MPEPKRLLLVSPPDVDALPQLLTMLATLAEPLEVNVRRGGFVARLVVAAEQPAGPVALSDVERRITEAIGGGCLCGKEIAARIGSRYDSTLRTILPNLVARGALAKASGGGYRLPVQDA